MGLASGRGPDGRITRDTGAGGHVAGGQSTEGCCCDMHQKARSHDISRIPWAKLMARVGEEFPLECPNCDDDIRLIASSLAAAAASAPASAVAASALRHSPSIGFLPPDSRAPPPAWAVSLRHREITWP